MKSKTVVFSKNWIYLGLGAFIWAAWGITSLHAQGLRYLETPENLKATAQRIREADDRNTPSSSPTNVADATPAASATDSSAVTSVSSSPQSVAQPEPKSAVVMPLGSANQTQESSLPQSSGSAMPTAADAAASVPAAEIWRVTLEQKTLKTTLTEWAKQANWTLVWEPDTDYVIEAGAEISGTFEEAVAVLSKSSMSAPKGFRAIFYQANHVLRIVSWENRS